MPAKSDVPQKGKQRKAKKKGRKRRGGIRLVGRLLGWTLLSANGVTAGAMAFCAYSSHLDPTLHPTLSCCGLAFPLLLIVNLGRLFFWFFFHRKYALLPQAALLLCGEAAWSTCPLNFFRREAPADAIKVLSYNVMGFHCDTPLSANNPTPVLTYLRESNADILCLQEFASYNRTMRAAIDEALKDYPYRHHQSIGQGGLGLACYSRFPILDAARVDYNSEGNGSVAYHIALSGDTLLLINNHLESNKLTRDDRAMMAEMIDDPAAEKVKEHSLLLLRKLAQTVPTRARQADAVAQLIEEAGEEATVIVCGDFNTAPYSYTYRTISDRLTDSFNESALGPQISYHERGFFFRIDYILHSANLKGYQCRIDRSIATSDHYPIWCYISPKTAR